MTLIEITQFCKDFGYLYEEWRESGYTFCVARPRTSVVFKPSGIDRLPEAGDCYDPSDEVGMYKARCGIMMVVARYGIHHRETYEPSVAAVELV